MLRAPRDLTCPDEKTLEQYLERTETLLKELHEALNEPGKAALIAAMADPSKSTNPFTGAAVLREPIFYGAESAYPSQYRDLSVLKYGRDDAWLTSNKGFSAEEAKKVVAAICDFLNENLLKTLKSLEGLPPEQWTMLGGFEFTAADIVTRSGLSVEKVDAVLTAFCFPDDGNPTFTALHEFNAANVFPILKGADDKYILFLYASLTEALYETPFYWMGADKAYEATAMANRGLFAEEFTADRLAKVFGDTNVLRNVDIWETKARKKKISEIDTLVLFGDRAIAVQAKSKKLTLAARKGNDLQMQADFKGAVQDACDQAMLCSENLLGKSAIFTDAHGNEIAITSLKQVYPVCVVTDHYPALSFQARQFLAYKATDAINAPLACDVFFIDVVAEFLETPLRLLSYLELRARVGENISLSHEITALGYHLKRNLWLGEHDFIALGDDLSVDVDIAMAARRDGVPGERVPPGILTALKETAVGRIIEQMERRSEPGAIGVGLELLKLSGESANKLSRGIDAIVASAAKDEKHHDITVASSQAASGITVHCNNLPETVAGPKLRRHCELRKYSEKAGTWAGLVVEPGTCSVRFGGMIEFPWKQDVEMDAAIADMAPPQPIDAALRSVTRRGTLKRTKIGRNDRCPCGSGKKYKKCHLLTGGWP
jgi:SEC-C motif